MNVTMTIEEYTVLKQRSAELIKIKNSIRQVRKIKKSDGTPDYFADEGSFEVDIYRDKLDDFIKKLIVETNNYLSEVEEDKIMFFYK